MNVFSILSYINKISLFVFFITAGFLFYQVYLFRKESSSERNKPNIPDFNKNIKIDVLNYTKLPMSLTNTSVPIKKENKTLLISVSALAFLTIVLFFIISMRSFSQPSPDNITVNITKPTNKPTSSPTPVDEINLSPTVKPTTTLTPSPTPTILSKASPSPTEVILAVISPSSEPEVTSSSVTVSPTKITSLPTTGIIDRGLVIFAVASLLILFSFVF